MGSNDKSWIAYDAESEFPVENIPFGVVRTADGDHCATRVGDKVLDLYVLSLAGLLGDGAGAKALQEPTLNAFMATGRSEWRAVRAAVQALVAKGNTALAESAVKDKAVLDAASVANVLPATVGDYTDFYSSREHATNVGTMFRGKDNALQPNWLHIPVGYHGRASSVVVDGTLIVRPCGQTKPADAPPVFGPSKRMDIELEVGVFVGKGNALGDRIAIEDADEHLFGVVLLNDWSARDIQKWEYVPLGPFLGKSFATTISPWIVTMDALAPFLAEAQPQVDPPVLPYLQDSRLSSYNIQLAVDYRTPAMDKPDTICRGTTRTLYWSFRQQLVHHSVNGCNMRPGDLLGSGTISGTEPSAFGSLLEMTWNGKNKVTLSSGEERTFLEDGDEITLRGFAQGDGYRVGFGLCRGALAPARQ